MRDVRQLIGLNLLRMFCGSYVPLVQTRSPKEGSELRPSTDPDALLTDCLYFNQSLKASNWLLVAFGLQCKSNAVYVSDVWTVWLLFWIVSSSYLPIIFFNIYACVLLSMIFILADAI